MVIQAMSISNNIPQKCHGCFKSSKPFIHDGCRFCRDLSFQEEILCYLNQSSHLISDFECHAYRPLLKLVTSGKKQSIPKTKDLPAKVTVEKQLDSDSNRVKYQRALALQKLTNDPESVMLEIKYHFVLSTIGRRSIFTDPDSSIDLIDDVISKCSEGVGGFSYLLWLAPDHMHIYVESDGTVSPDDMAKKFKASEKLIIKQAPELIGASASKKRLWSDSYFVETI